MRELLEKYIGTLANAMRGAEVTDRASKKLTLESGCEWVRKAAHEAHNAGNKIIFVGNGGSAGIASHLAIDFSKNGGLRALAFNDPSALTCLGNDLGYDRVFAKQIELYARAGDLVIAISSSGRSPNILNAVKAARAATCAVVTLSGFTADNPLRCLGDINFYVASDRYGFVEIGHLTICHAILDFICGLRVPEGMMPTGANAA
jgi:D-sedoheptulose 7-phosphate isomerase